MKNVILSLVIAITFGFSEAAHTTVLTPGTGGQLPDVFAGCAGCTLLASTNSGVITTSFGGLVLNFDLVTAVYSDPSNTFGAGDLDFMYQVTNEATSTDSIGRVTAINFTGFQTDVGYTAAGSTLPGGLFVNGAVPPGLVDRNTASTIGFGFAVPPLFALVPPGEASSVLIIQTDATHFDGGQANVIDGTAKSVEVLGPVGAVATPDTGSTLGLLALALAALVGASRLRSIQLA